MSRPDIYAGIDDDANGGMTTIGKLIRDAQVFGLIDDSETCKGWDYGRVVSLLDQVNQEWDKYGCMVSNLPQELFDRHQMIHAAGVKRAKEAGWSGDNETDDETK